MPICSKVGQTTNRTAHTLSTRKEAFYGKGAHTLYTSHPTVELLHFEAEGF